MSTDDPRNETGAAEPGSAAEAAPAEPVTTADAPTPLSTLLGGVAEDASTCSADGSCD